jgi:RNA polymerase sigma-70 factor (ECF subfamily)
MEADDFATSLKTYEGKLIAYASTFLGDVERAKDAVQDTFLKLWNQPNRPSSLKPWLYTTCRNRCIDILRKERRTIFVDHQELEAHESQFPRPDLSAAGNDNYRNLLRLLECLSKNQQEVIRLRFDADLSYREISAVTGLSEGNVGFLLHTGLKKLKLLASNTETATHRTTNSTSE